MMTRVERRKRMMIKEKAVVAADENPDDAAVCIFHNQFGDPCEEPPSFPCVLALSS